MTTDAFTTAARAEAPPACEHYWISHSQDSVLIPWVIRCHLCGAFNIAEMERVARTHLAAQEPTAAERAVRELHHEREWRQLDGTYIGGTVCNACRRPYPCPTISVLDRDRAALTAAKEARHG